MQVGRDKSSFWLLLLGLILFPVLIEPALARPICDPFPSPPPSKTTSPPKPKWDPTEFPVVTGGSSGNPLIFVGDSLTVGNGATRSTANYPEMVSRELGDRAYVMFALPGQTSTKLADLFSKTIFPQESIGIIWIGLNNSAQSESIVADAVAVSSRFSSGKFLVLSILKGRWWSQQPGNPADIEMDVTDDLLQLKFGHNFINVNETLECNDFADNTHPNDHGNAKIAELVSNELLLRGW